MNTINVIRQVNAQEIMSTQNEKVMTHGKAQICTTTVVRYVHTS